MSSLPPLTPTPPTHHHHSLQPPPVYHTVKSMQSRMDQQLLPEESPRSTGKIMKPKPVLDRPILRKPRKTNPLVWCAAVLCMFISLLVILCGIATLIIFVSFRPKSPVFDTPGASLNFIYLNSLEHFNGDLTFLANFSNPNKKLDVIFEHVEMELYFSDNLVATQALPPFLQRQKETQMVSVHMISSLVYLPPSAALELQKQVQSKRVVFNLRATLKVKVKLGIAHLSYWLHGRCHLELNSPPNGFLLAHSCNIKR